MSLDPTAAAEAAAKASSEATEHAHAVEALSAELWPLIAPRLAGRPPEVQSAVLAELAAIWLAGHVVPGDPAATAAMRSELFRLYVRLVADLIGHQMAAEALRGEPTT